MKTTFKFVALLLGMGFFTLAANAQRKVIVEDDEPNSIVLVSKDKAGDEIVKIMQDTRLQKFNEPNAPRFLLTDRKGKFALGIGGYVQAVAEYDFGGIVKDIDFFPSFIPEKGTTAVKNQFQMDITTSTLFLKLVGRTKRLGDFVVYAAGNFRGNDNTFQLQNAYAQFLGFTVGYSYGNFMDLPAIPPTIDYAGPSGVVYYRTTQLSYTYDKLKHWRFTGAIEMPSVDGTYATASDNKYTAESAAQRMPDFSANIQYSWKPGNQIRAAGLIRSMTYNSFNYDGDLSAKSELGWGVQLSSTFMLTKKLQFYGQANYGKGIGQFFNDISNLNVDLVPDPENPSKMQALPMMGWYAGLQYNITPNVFVSSTYSATRLYSNDGWPINNSDFYRYGQYLVANVFWNVTPNMQVGAEYLRGWRTGFLDNSTRHANRINVMAQYSF